MTAPVWVGSILATEEAARTLINGCWVSSWVRDIRSGMASSAAAPRSARADTALTLTRGSGLPRSENKVLSISYVAVIRTKRRGEPVLSHLTQMIGCDQRTHRTGRDKSWTAFSGTGRQELVPSSDDTNELVGDNEDESFAEIKSQYFQDYL